MEGMKTTPVTQLLALTLLSAISGCGYPPAEPDGNNGVLYFQGEVNPIRNAEFTMTLPQSIESACGGLCAQEAIWSVDFSRTTLEVRPAAGLEVLGIDSPA